MPFQGGAPAINATLGNQIDLLATTLGGGAAAQIAGGKLKGLGIAADKRASVTPDVPTFCRSPDFPVSSPRPGSASSRRPRPTRRSLRRSMPRSMRPIKNPDVRKKLSDHRLRCDRRIARAGRGPVQGRSRQVGRDGQGPELVDQIADVKTEGVERCFPLPKGEGALAKRGRVRVFGVARRSSQATSSRSDRR